MSEDLMAQAKRMVAEMIERRKQYPTKQVRYDRPPDHKDEHGEAWHFETPAGDVTCGGWVLHCEWAHPAWEYWLVSAVNLRDTPDHEPAKLLFPEATHEVIIAALDPDHPLPTGKGTAVLLRPLDVMHQVHLHDDSQCVDLLKLVVEVCCRGRMSPDSDFRGIWMTMLNGTAAHLRGEHDS